MRAVDVLVHLTTARFDRALTYSISDGPVLRVGDIVRVPLGSREVFAYVVTAEREIDAAPIALRAIAARADAPRAFDEEGLALARWVAQTYLCSLREALATIVLADAGAAGGGAARPDRCAAGARAFPERPRAPRALAVGGGGSRYLTGGVAAASGSPALR